MGNIPTELRRFLARRPTGEALVLLSELLPEAAVFVVNAEREVVFWNQNAVSLLGYEPGDVLGNPCSVAIRCATCMVGCGIAEQKAVRKVPLTLHKKRGGSVRVLKYADGFFDDSGTFAGGIELLLPTGDNQPMDDLQNFHGMVSRDPAMHRIFQLIRNVAESDATVLVRGESGTGKELVARAIHAESARQKGPFVAVNCAAFTATLLESALFGHVKGAFTGAVSDHPGIFAQAHGGTLFLDEVAELPLDLQARLLRVLQERVVQPVGSTKPIQVDVRIVAATHRALREEVKAGRFREDLMYRLRVVPIFLPPLADRVGDVPLLLGAFLDKANQKLPSRSNRPRHFSPEAMGLLENWRWPGNIRELENVVTYALAVGRGADLGVEDLPPEFRESHDSSDVDDDQDESTRIRMALEACKGNVGEAAIRLGMSRPTFWRKRKKYGI